MSDYQFFKLVLTYRDFNTCLTFNNELSNSLQNIGGLASAW